MKPGEEVVSVNVGWMVERFVIERKEKKRKEVAEGEECAREGENKTFWNFFQSTRLRREIRNHETQRFKVQSFQITEI